MKVTIYPPDHKSRVLDFKNIEAGYIWKEGIEIEAFTLGDAIQISSEIMECEIVEASNHSGEYSYGDKYHCLKFFDGSERLIDIHIFRKDKEICPKYDYDFKLLESDKIIFGQLLC